MKYLLVLLLSFLSIHNLSAQQVINSSLTHDGITRNYILFIPSSYDPATPAPLVFSFHGYSSNASLNANYTGFTAIADTAGFILVHPDGTLDGTGTSHWNVGGWTVGSQIDDVGFTEAMIDEISASYNVNANRIYSCGMSNGGYMSFKLACELSDRFAAIASVTGSMTPQISNACNPSHPTPILQLHGTADPTVPYNGSPTWTLAIDDVIDYWVGFNNCNTTPIITAIDDNDSSDGTNVDHFVYAGGDNGVTTEHFKVYNGEHDWFGVWGNMDISSSIEIWKFFSRYDINGSLANVNELTLVDEIKVFPNPSNEFISVNISMPGDLYYEIVSLEGKIIKSGTLSNTLPSIDISSLSNDIYFLKINNQVLKFVVKR
jgi:polyhydroxybutyrate depolymerase